MSPDALKTQLIQAREIHTGDRLPSNRGLFTVTEVTHKGSKVIARMAEETPEGTSITFGASEIVSVNRADESF